MPVTSDPLRPALELAFDVARVGATARPPVPAPPPLRPYLRFTKVTAPVLDAVRRVVETDGDFRARVALLADEAEIGRAGRLWLERPDGWEAELEALLAEMPEDDAEPSPREARRRERERAARSRVHDELREERASAQALRGELAAERAARSEAERAATAAVSDNVRLAEERAQAIRRLKAAEARAADAATERNALRRRLRDLERAAQPAAGPEPGTADESKSRLRGDEPGSGDMDVTPPIEVGEPVDADFDRGAMAAAVSAAAAAASSLAQALDDLVRAIEPDVSQPSGDSHTIAAPEPSDAVPAAQQDMARAASARREPAALPGGVLDDSADAAEHLLRVKGAVLLIDGYNVTKAAWPDLTPAEQRARLVQALGTLTARTGIEIDVVFDGAEVVPAAPLLSPRGVRVRYSEPGVEADDVVIGLVDEHPPTRPVVVASSDGRVREGARRRGANLLHARQLLAAIRR